ncbi:hypothetical protein Mlute_00396 [Meiothermus luteus]|uniref:DUF4367 domain-containing protein n=1 Tax=Meiothermus luteus TaxID=2026184 RepID=A0A399F1P6_9DEIN|nr:hypothetical protein Mlute_00396 [Meiothermus luteus]
MPGRHVQVLFLLAVLVLTIGLAQANQPTPGPTAGPCSLLSKQEVLEAIKASEAKKPGKPPAITWEGAGQDEFPEGVRWCIYSYSLEWAKGDKWSYGIRVSYQRDPGAPQLLREVKSNVRKTFYSVEPLRGLGEEAYWVDNVRLYVWVKGGLLVIDHGFRANQKELSIQLAKLATGRIR